MPLTIYLLGEALSTTYAQNPLRVQEGAKRHEHASKYFLSHLKGNNLVQEIQCLYGFDPSFLCGVQFGGREILCA